MDKFNNNRYDQWKMTHYLDEEDPEDMFDILLNELEKEYDSLIDLYLTATTEEEINDIEDKLTNVFKSYVSIVEELDNMGNNRATQVTREIFRHITHEKGLYL